MSEGGSRIPKIVWITTPTIVVCFVAFIYYLTTIPSGDELSAVKGDAKKAFQQGLEEAEQAVTDKVIEELAGDDEAASALAAKAADTLKAAKAEQAKDQKTNYGFYEILKEQTVEVETVDAYVSTPKDETPQHQYILQVASFRSADEADALRADLIFSDLTATIESAEVKGSTWHRVYVGPFTDRSKLNKAQDALVSKNLNAIVIKRPLAK